MPRLDRGIQGRPERLFVALDCPVKPGNDNGELMADFQYSGKFRNSTET
jgi:hypothetical protein